MNDAEIIKALEDSIEYDCERCPHRPHNDCEWTDCETILSKNILELLKRQQAEINLFSDIGKLYSEIRAEAIKDFADALKSKSELVAPSVYAVPYRAVSVDDIDNLVKEMTGGEENAD